MYTVIRRSSNNFSASLPAAGADRALLWNGHILMGTSCKNALDYWHPAIRGGLGAPLLCLFPNINAWSPAEGESKWKVLQESPMHDKHLVIQSKETSNYMEVLIRSCLACRPLARWHLHVALMYCGLVLTSLHTVYLNNIGPLKVFYYVPNILSHFALKILKYIISTLKWIKSAIKPSSFMFPNLGSGITWPSWYLSAIPSICCKTMQHVSFWIKGTPSRKTPSLCV